MIASITYLSFLFFFASTMEVVAFRSVSGLRMPSLSTSLLMADVNSFYDIVEKDVNGKDVSFKKFKGKVVYGVNVASRCGYTASGYALLSRISALKNKGVEVI